MELQLNQWLIDICTNDFDPIDSLKFTKSNPAKRRHTSALTIVIVKPR